MSQRPYRVMTVCTGNICRSPMAEVVLRDRFERAGLGDDVVVDSTGISAEETGNPIDRRARQVLAANGYDVPRRQARRITAVDLVNHDLVLPMTAAHAHALRRLAHDEPEAVERIRMYRSFDPEAPQGGPEHLLDVDDPWYGDDAGFDVTMAEVEAAADGIVEHVRRGLDARRAGRRPGAEPSGHATPSAEPGGHATPSAAANDQASSPADPSGDGAPSAVANDPGRPA